MLDNPKLNPVQRGCFAVADDTGCDRGDGPRLDGGSGNDLEQVAGGIVLIFGGLPVGVGDSGEATKGS